MEKDLFIFDYLEGNLSKSKQDLFEEMLENDPSFAAEVKAWRKTYFEQSTSTVSFGTKRNLFPKKYSLALKSLFGGVSIAAISYLYLHIHEQNKQIILQSTNPISQKITQTLIQKDTVFVIKKQEYIAYKHPTKSPRFMALSTPKEATPSKDVALPISENLMVYSHTEIKQKPVYRSIISETKFELEAQEFETTCEHKQTKHKTQKPKLASWKDIKRAYATQRVIPLN